MNLSELIKLRESLLNSLEIIESDIDKLRTSAKKRISHYTENKFIYIKPQVLALAILLDNPDIAADELARRVGVNRATLYRWENVAKYLRARQKMQHTMRQSEEK